MSVADVARQELDQLRVAIAEQERSLDALRTQEDTLMQVLDMFGEGAGARTEGMSTHFKAPSTPVANGTGTVSKLQTSTKVDGKGRPSTGWDPMSRGRGINPKTYDAYVTYVREHQGSTRPQIEAGLKAKGVAGLAAEGYIVDYGEFCGDLVAVKSPSPKGGRSTEIIFTADYHATQEARVRQEQILAENQRLHSEAKSKQIASAKGVTEDTKVVDGAPEKKRETVIAPRANMVREGRVVING